MKSLELQPTAEHIKRTYCDNTIRRNDGLHKFIEMLNMINESCVVAVDGGWGSGKTFFVKQAKMILDAFNPSITIYKREDDEAIQAVWKAAQQPDAVGFNPCISVYYDAWENDNDDDPLLSIIHEILNVVNTDYKFKLEERLRFIKTAAAIAELVTGKKVQALIDAVKSDDPFAHIKKSRDIKEKIMEFFNGLLPEQGNRLIIFIDELDRCKPSFAVKLLERIKHYLTNNRIIFVLSVNSHELQNTVKRYYGDGFDACRYLDRFFDLRVELPPVNLQQYCQCLEFEPNSYIYDTVALAVIQKYRFELREIAKYIRLIKIAAYKPTHEFNCYTFSSPKEKGRSFCLAVIVPIMIGLKMHNSTRYRSFIEGKDATPLIEIMEKGDIGLSLCNSLLGSKETYEENQEGSITVGLPEKLEDVYHALFIQEDQAGGRGIRIGNMFFDSNTKKIPMEAISLLSGFANYT